MNILVCVPIRPDLNKTLKEKCFKLIEGLPAANPEHTISTHFDESKIPNNIGGTIKKNARNKLLSEVDLNKWDYLLWIDADIVDYPLDMPTKLINCNPTGISAPLILIENSKKFYDYGAFAIHNRGDLPSNDKTLKRVRTFPPYWEKEPIERIVPMDGVGTVTMIPSWIYKNGVKYTDTKFTEHYSICQAVRKAGHSVVCNRDIIAYHADLPKYEGEKWH